MTDRGRASWSAATRRPAPGLAEDGVALGAQAGDDPALDVALADPGAVRGWCGGLGGALMEGGRLGPEHRDAHGCLFTSLSEG